jgi:geranylgeranyl reductase family protein
VIVAGAGPAGAVAARTLAAAGVDTLLVDRAAFPRNKPCGGGLTARAPRRFPWLEAAIAGIDVHRVGRLHLEGPAGAALDLTERRACVLLVRRIEFDSALVEQARAAGARLTRFEITQAGQDESGVTLRSREGRLLRAPFVIAADGVNSVVAKRLGVNARWPRSAMALDMMEESPSATLRARDPDVLWVAYGYDGLDGYAYVFPKLRHVNVGIGCLLSHFDDAVSARPYELQSRFVDALVGRGVLEGRSDRDAFTPFLIPVGGPLERSWTGRVLFAGDAGGFVHAITAEGIYYAMVSGELAARALAEGVRRGDPARAGSEYERLWRREVGAELEDAVRLQRHLFSRSGRVSKAIRMAAGAPGLVKAILDYVCGDLSYGALRRRLALRFPGAALRIAASLLAGSVGAGPKAAAR